LPTSWAPAAEAGYQGVEIFENDLTYFDGRPEDVRVPAGSLGLEIVALQPFRDFKGLPEPARSKAAERARRKFELMGRGHCRRRCPSDGCPSDDGGAVDGGRAEGQRGAGDAVVAPEQINPEGVAVAAVGGAVEHLGRGAAAADGTRIRPPSNELPVAWCTATGSTAWIIVVRLSVDHRR